MNNGENQMKELWLVRHAQSEGQKPGSTNSNPLTELGQQQAQGAANYLAKIVDPDVIIHSSSVQTEQTAEQFINQVGYRSYTVTPVEVWDIQEYTYLSEKHWDNMDPDYMDGDGAESFNQMLGRVERFIRHFLQSRYGTAVAFTHGQFMKAVLCLLQAEGMHGRLPTMSEFYALHMGMEIPYTGIIKLNFCNEPGSTRISFLKVRK